MENKDVIKKNYNEYRENMTKEPNTKIVLDAYDVEMAKKSDNIYGIDEISLIVGIYGVSSEIYNAMAKGEAVSGMIKESIEKHSKEGKLNLAKREEVLLSMCVKKEEAKLIANAETAEETGATKNKKYVRTNQRNFRKNPIKIESNLPKEAQLNNLIAGMPTGMVRELSNIIKMSGCENLIYGIDEITLIVEIYGVGSDIYKAVAEEKHVSGMIKESIEKHSKEGKLDLVKKEEKLLAMCLETEQNYTV